MPYRLRTVDPAGTYHVASRGNNGEPIFRDAFDRAVFSELVARTMKRYAWTCLAYCQMTNHYHLLIRLQADGLSRGMQELNSGFARFANQRHGRTGHLFRNRFVSAEVLRESHLLEACRYIVLNPVRAGICGTAEEWQWSSYRACAGADYGPSFLAVDEVLRLFGARPEAARASFRAFVADGDVSRCQTPGRGWI